jgi:hypothetical protein
MRFVAIKSVDQQFDAWHRQNPRIPKRPFDLVLRIGADLHIPS